MNARNANSAATPAKVVYIARKAARHRPHCTGVESIEQHRVRHQPGGFLDAPVNLLEPRKKTRHRAGADSDMIAYCYVFPSEFAGINPYPLLRRRILHPQQVVGEFLAEPAVHFANTLARGRAPDQPAVVDPLLHGDMCFRFELQVALTSI
jgi:hypothetical protein